MSFNLVIMAAGSGSRFGGQKQFAPVTDNQATTMDYSIHDAFKHGFNKVFLIISSSSVEFIENRYAELIRNERLSYVTQEMGDLPESYQDLGLDRKKPWGTGHIIYLLWKNNLTEKFVLINADDFYTSNAFQCAADYFNKNNGEGGSALLGFQLMNTLSPNGTVSRGLCEIEEAGYGEERLFLSNLNEVKNIQWEGDKIEHDSDISINGDNLVSMNFWLFDSNDLSLIQEPFLDFLNRYRMNGKINSEFLITDYVNTLIEQKHKIEIIPFDQKWYGITYKADLGVIRQHLSQSTMAEQYSGIAENYQT